MHNASHIMHPAQFVLNLSLSSGFVKIFNQIVFFLKQIDNLHDSIQNLFHSSFSNINNTSASKI